MPLINPLTNAAKITTNAVDLTESVNIYDKFASYPIAQRTTHTHLAITTITNNPQQTNDQPIHHHYASG